MRYLLTIFDGISLEHRSVSSKLLAFSSEYSMFNFHIRILGIPTPTLELSTLESFHLLATQSNYPTYIICTHCTPLPMPYLGLV